MKLNKCAGTLAAALAPALLLASPALADPATITVQVDRPSHKVAPTLWGIFFEDINLSADGGIYPELVRNRSFEDATKPDSWQLTPAAGVQAEMTIDSSKPLTPFNRRSLRLHLSGADDAGARLVNAGYWGMNIVEGATYRLSLAARTADGFHGPVTVTLEGASGQRLAQGTLNGIGAGWKTYTLDLRATGTDAKARLAISVASKGTLWLDMVSLLPQATWKGHGLRPDLCEMLDGLKPSFVRFPGGCWVEGDDMAHMNHWKNTVGDVANRVPLWNIWGYWATHGLGFHEYLQMSEDLHAEPLFCINVGMSHQEVIPMDQMGSWVQDALDALEYANGPTNTVWGGLRARNGHPEPFNLRYMEIGNENGGPAYTERYALFYRAIKARYPEVNLIADEWGGVPTSAPVDIVDEHYYSNPEFFIQQAHRYDTYKRTGPKVFVGEYAVTQGCGQGNLRGAIGEAAFMTGMERNSDVVVMASYAPLFVNVNHKRWNPDLINFDSARAYGLPSYYVQRLFSEHRGDVVLPSEVEAPATGAGPKGGAVGVGTWLTQAEFKDIKVTRGGETLYAADFASGTQGWNLLGGGDWKAQDGALRQSSNRDNVRAVTGDKSWSDYTYSLKARKLGGAEGFLILFRVQNEEEKSWWNLGGWGNVRHAVEMNGVVGNSVDGQIETGRWYDIRIELKGDSIKCYLDNRLIHDIKAPTMKSLYASATRAANNGDVILKVVNVAADPQPARVALQGVAKTANPAQAIVLTSDKPTDENSLESPTKVSPKTSSLTLDNPVFDHTFPGNSVTVLRVRPE
jgi:alpha-L-arabinofuranosidase